MPLATEAVRTAFRVGSCVGAANDAFEHATNARESCSTIVTSISKNDAETKPATAPKPGAELSQKPNSTIKPGVAAVPPHKSDRPHDVTTNVEHNLLDSFKQFSAAEKLRMSERQRALQREHKVVKLNDLKKFALNFKLSTPVPSDLVPILAKDGAKQQAIVEKALRQAQETKTTPPKTSSTISNPKAATRSATKPESTNSSPSASLYRQQNQRPRPRQPPYASASMKERSHQNVSQIPPWNQGLLSSRLQLNQQQHKQQDTLPYNCVPLPIPAQDQRIPPTGPSQPSSSTQTPTSTVSTRFNVRAHEFKPNPAAHTFLSGGTSSANSSPRPKSASKHEVRRPPTVISFSGGQCPSAKPLNSKTTFNSIARMGKETQEKERKWASSWTAFPCHESDMSFGISLTDIFEVIEGCLWLQELFDKNNSAGKLQRSYLLGCGLACRICIH